MKKITDTQRSCKGERLAGSQLHQAPAIILPATGEGELHASKAAETHAGTFYFHHPLNFTL